MSTTKDIVEITIDGLKDYCTNQESFNARFVCGQLFLYGNASSFDVGMPGTFNGEDKTRLTYIQDWIAALWQANMTRYLELTHKYKKYDPFKDSVMQQFAKVSSPVNLPEYVQLVVKLNESLNYTKAKLVKIQKHSTDCSRIARGLQGIEYHAAGNLLTQLAADLSQAAETLGRDYTGYSLHPTATLTLFSVADHLNILMHRSADKLVLPSPITEGVSWTAKRASAMIEESFSPTTLSELVDIDVHIFLVKANDALKAAVETILYLSNTTQLANKLIKQLTDQPS